MDEHRREESVDNHTGISNSAEHVSSWCIGVSEVLSAKKTSDTLKRDTIDHNSQIKGVVN